MTKHTGTQDYAEYTEDRCSNEGTCPVCTPLVAERRDRRCAKCGEHIITAMGQVVFRREGLDFTSSGREDLVACLSCPNVLSEDDVALARQNGWTRPSEPTAADNPMDRACANCGAEAGQPCDYFCTAQPTVND